MAPIRSVGASGGSPVDAGKQVLHEVTEARSARHRDAVDDCSTQQVDGQRGA